MTIYYVFVTNNYKLELFSLQVLIFFVKQHCHSLIVWHRIVRYCGKNYLMILDNRSPDYPHLNKKNPSDSCVNSVLSVLSSETFAPTHYKYFDLTLTSVFTTEKH